MTTPATEQQDTGRGPLAARPPAGDVPVGYLWECDDSADRWRSDGEHWHLANAETDAWRLRYAEDLTVGSEIRRLAEIPVKNRPQQQMTGLLTLIAGGAQGCGHLHLLEWVIIAERRDAGDLIACIGVRPGGEQVPLYLGRLEMVQVRNEELA